MCSFCNQVKITGSAKQPDANDIKTAVENSGLFGKKGVLREIAFFGGSFTAIDRNYMKELLSCAHKYIELGYADGIRISTRPDCIDHEILDILKSYSVTAIELGAQSMREGVLEANNRGHSAKSVKDSSSLIKGYGFELGLQMMTGLYGSSMDDDIYTAQEFIKLKPDVVRIYPTIIMKGTHLEELYVLGEYTPMTLNSAVDLCSELLCMFGSNGIDVIRVGLHSSKSMTQNFVAGPWHPSFRELCENKIIIDRCIGIIKKLRLTNKPVRILVSPRDLSKVVGQRRLGIEEIKKICPQVEVKPESSLKLGNLIVEELKKS